MLENVMAASCMINIKARPFERLDEPSGFNRWNRAHYNYAATLRRSMIDAPDASDGGVSPSIRRDSK